MTQNLNCTLHIVLNLNIGAFSLEIPDLKTDLLKRNCSLILSLSQVSLFSHSVSRHFVGGGQCWEPQGARCTVPSGLVLLVLWPLGNGADAAGLGAAALLKPGHLLEGPFVAWLVVERMPRDRTKEGVTLNVTHTTSPGTQAVASIKLQELSE